ncbi:hypothetical protein SLEP1_g16921 [Rubroshorea leprosula]|uniref:Uncharacterized protein n=1 Tax=Rubroshorea leprosula TaxID=152421 RepID=A0AAV5IYB0_9ROSI|nr:hypothetical protein SLEP1_g16921 [Rubroshorea leprosula]
MFYDLFIHAWKESFPSRDDGVTLSAVSRRLELLKTPPLVGGDEYIKFTLPEETQLSHVELAIHPTA